MLANKTSRPTNKSQPIVLRDEMGALSMVKSLARDFCASFAQKQTVARSGPFMRALEAGGRRNSRHEGHDELPLPSVRRAVHQSRGSALPDLGCSARYICRDPLAIESTSS